MFRIIINAIINLPIISRSQRISRCFKFTRIKLKSQVQLELIIDSISCTVQDIESIINSKKSSCLAIVELKFSSKNIWTPLRPISKTK